MSDESYYAEEDYPSYGYQTTNHTKYLIWLLLVILGAGAGFGGATYWHSQENSEAIILRQPFQLESLHLIPYQSKLSFLEIKTDLALLQPEKEQKDRTSTYAERQLIKCLEDVQSALEDRDFSRAHLTDRASLEMPVRRIQVAPDADGKCAFVEKGPKPNEFVSIPVYGQDGKVVLRDILRTIYAGTLAGQPRAS